jgi:rhodanese-related sulfurtransferase
MKSYQNLVNECLKIVEEIYPWDLQERLENADPLMLLDIREPYEFDAFHIKNAMNVPRGILEAACDYGYDETVPELVKGRDQEIIVICRSGNRSILAAHTMQIMGYQSVKSLKTGVKGWNDYDLPLLDTHNEIVDGDDADVLLTPNVKPEQMAPKKNKPT